MGVGVGESRTAPYLFKAQGGVTLLVGTEPRKLMIEIVEHLVDASSDVWQLIFLSQNSE